MKAILLSIVLSTLCLLTGCSKESSNTNTPLKIGVIAGPEFQVMQVAVEQAQKQFGLKTKIVEFQDYVTPNIALADGSIDVNAYQHQIYLDNVNQSQHLNLVAVGKTFLYPLGAYSKKIKDIKSLKNKSTVSIPNDPTNEYRALKMLEKAGLITLKNTKKLTATVHDIEKNPKQLNIVELDAAQLVRSLDDVDLSFINSTFAVNAGLLPTQDALLLESNTSPYANLIVARSKDKEDPRIKELVKAYQSEAVMKAAKNIFKGGAIPSWNQSHLTN